MIALIFQNFGFAYSRFVASFFLNALAFFSSKKIVGKKKISLDLFNLILIKSVIIIPYFAIEVFTSNNFIVPKDIFTTTIFEVLFIIYYHISRDSNVLLKVDYLLAPILLIVGLIILYLSAEFRSNYLVRDLKVSGNDNRFMAILITIMCYYIVLLPKKNPLNVALLLSLFYVAYLINARGSMLSLVLLSFVWFCFKIKISKPDLRFLCIILFIVFNILYLSSIFLLDDPSSVIRLKHAQYVMSLDFLHYGMVEPHFVTLSFIQVYFLLGPILILCAFYFFHPVVCLIVFVNFSFSSEFFTQIFLSLLIIFSRMFNERNP